MYLVHDIVYTTRNLIPYPENLKIFTEKLFFGGFVIFGLAAVISIFSIFNSKMIKTKEYNIQLDKKESILEELNIIYISDGHIGTTLNKDNINKLVEKINKLNPDIVFLGGDYFDEGSTENTKKISSKELSKIKSKYGIYAVEGNHEYKSGDSKINEEMQYFKDVGIKVLQDEVFEIENKLYIVGRKDKHGEIKKQQGGIGNANSSVSRRLSGVYFKIKQTASGGSFH